MTNEEMIENLKCVIADISEQCVVPRMGHVS